MELHSVIPFPMINSEDPQDQPSLSTIVSWQGGIILIPNADFGTCIQLKERRKDQTSLVTKDYE